MKSYLRRWFSVGYGYFLVGWLYLSTGYRFWRWRVHLWLHQSHEEESTQTGMKHTLLFIRHGQTTWNAEQRLPGQLPGVLLNDTGREQAACLADALSALPIQVIISSPLERAKDTAEIIAQGRGLAVQLEPDLMDTQIRQWAGQNYNELAKTDPAWPAYIKDPTVAPEGIETFPQVQQRSVAAVERWLAREPGAAYLAFVAHADVVKLLIAHYSGLEAGKAGIMLIENASVSIVELDSEHAYQARIVAIGWNPRPGWLKPPELKPRPELESETAKGTETTAVVPQTGDERSS